MRALIQRILNSEVRIDGKIHSETAAGLLIFLGISPRDTESQAGYLARKITALRVFEDAKGKMNLSVTDAEGEIMVVSQFTLYADTAKGNRPSFTSAADPVHAEKIYHYFIRQIANNFSGRVASGVFGADMKVSLVNDGPVTIFIDTDSTGD
ncbi:MAG: D-aminoacyl-tRNA deacylase [Spirochaetia bacterium]|nr:D-aminoacyl-tRNA deacylase [Spirochaetia bacterium]